ncbi:diguanylate cyclase domain-containing protein [Roseburia faecis]|uniref:sensor domain-containing diguanylate cyclase n=1 Tax=Roseburia faecis TaxID=301302 RepID=UPI003BB1F9B2
MREQKEQEKQNELLRVVAEQNHERLIEYDVKEDRAVVYAIENDRFEVLFDIEDYVKKNHYGSVFIDPEDKKVFRRAMHACLQKEGTVTVDVRYCEKENQPEWYRFYLVSIAEEDGKTDRMVGRFCCVQQEKAITERMRRRAEIDVLTNVYNHKAFEEYCAKELAECTTNALFVMLDIDDFKMINDTQGHAVGDMVLSQTGSILSEVTGDRGIVGRLGGDEFAVFASGFQNSVEMEEFCVSLRENLKKIIFDMEYSVSIGAAKLDGRRISFPDFYYEADRAVYAAKRGGKNRIVFYDQIKENQEPETADPVEPILAQGNEKSMLRQLRTCMEALGREGIGDALMQTFEALRQYFDADCVVLAYAKEGGIRYVEECHRDTAQMMARLVTEEIESGDAEGVIQEIGQLGDVVIPDIKSLRESHPVIYEYLAELRAWSAAGISLYTGDHLLGILMVLNPHRHLEEADVLSMLGTTLAARIELRNLQEQQEYDRTHDKLTNLWNREGLSVMARTGEDNMFCSLGVITTDVIHLSEINKQFGYISGNRRLMEVADLLKSMFPNYRIYRYDEDEMLVLCINIKRQEMEQQVENLQKRLAGLGFGVAMGYSWSAHPQTRSQIAEAEVLMSNDKLKLMHGTTVMKRMEQSVIDEINDLMERGRYLVYLQPKVDIHTGRTEGAEALIRQLDDELGIVGTGDVYSGAGTLQSGAYD